MYWGKFTKGKQAVSLAREIAPYKGSGPRAY